MKLTFYTDKEWRSGALMARFLVYVHPILTVLLPIALGAGCAGKLEDKKVASSRLEKPDFQDTTIETKIPGVADGETPLAVIVKLRNSDGSAVIGYTPAFTISGADPLKGSCGKSDQNGNAACAFQASVSGSRTFTLTNAKPGLSQVLNFRGAVPDQNAMVRSGAISTVTSDGYRVKMNLGGPVHKYNATTVDRYKFNLDISTSKRRRILAPRARVTR